MDLLASIQASLRAAQVCAQPQRTPNPSHVLQSTQTAQLPSGSHAATRPQAPGLLTALPQPTKQRWIEVVGIPGDGTDAFVTGATEPPPYLHLGGFQSWW